MVIINATPHPVNVYPPGKDPVVYPPSGEKIRVEFEQLCLDEGPIPIRRVKAHGRLVCSFEKRPGVYYIVSTVVALACPDRDDFLVPDTDLAIRDSEGRILGVPGFKQFVFNGGE